METAIVEQINNAFFRFENFANGTINSYQYFDFNKAFTELFNEAKKQENYTNENCKLIGEYWKLTEQIVYDFDKGKFKNENAYKNEDFCKVCDEIGHLNWERIEEFGEFTTPDEIAESEKKISIMDILKPQSEANKKTKEKPQQQNTTIEIKPTFKPEIIDTLHGILKDFFETTRQAELKTILQNGNNASQKLLFKDNGNRLTDTFKQLIEKDLITGCDKQNIEKWICDNFQFLNKGNAKDFTKATVNKTISKNTQPCKAPLISIDENGNITKVENGKKKTVNKN